VTKKGINYFNLWTHYFFSWYPVNLINALWTVHGADFFREEHTDTLFSFFASSSDFYKMSVIKPRLGRPSGYKTPCADVPFGIFTKSIFQKVTSFRKTHTK